MNGGWRRAPACFRRVPAASAGAEAPGGPPPCWRPPGDRSRRGRRPLGGCAAPGRSEAEIESPRRGPTVDTDRAAPFLYKTTPMISNNSRLTEANRDGVL